MGLKAEMERERQRILNRGYGAVQGELTAKQRSALKKNDPDAYEEIERQLKALELTGEPSPGPERETLEETAERRKNPAVAVTETHEAGFLPAPPPASGTPAEDRTDAALTPQDRKAAEKSEKRSEKLERELAPLRTPPPSETAGGV